MTDGYGPGIFILLTLNVLIVCVLGHSVASGLRDIKAFLKEILEELRNRR